MGFGGISIWSLVLILGIVILLFGTKKLRNVGGDLGSAIKNFKKSVTDEGVAKDSAEPEAQIDGQIIEGKVKEEDKV